MSERPPLHVLSVVAGLYAGGAELLLYEFAKAAPEAGIRLSVCALGGRDEGPAGTRLRRIGIEPHSLGLRGLLDPRDLNRMRAHIAAIGPDLVHTHLTYPDIVGLLAARWAGVPAVSTIHSDGFAGGVRGRAKERLAALVRRRCASRVIAVSERARQTYLQTGWDRPDRVITVHNAISPEPRRGAGAAVRRDLGIPADAPVAMMLSVLRPEKRHPLALEAVRSILATHPDFRLLIVGDGVERQRIEAAAAGFGDSVLMIGHSDDPMPLLDASDLLLHCSSTEGFPTALVEAMAAAVPIVAVAVGGIPELVDDGANGLLVPPPGDAEALATAVGSLLADPALRRRLGERGRRRYEAELTGERWALRVREVYDAVLAG